MAEDLAPAGAAPPPNEVMGAFLEALHRIQRHNEELVFLRNASDRASNHFEAARVELLARDDRMAQTMWNQAEHAAHQGADIRRLAAQLNDFQFQRPHREIIDPKFPTWNGSRETIEQWLLHLTEFIALKNLPDLQAVGYAKLAMPHHCRDVLRTLPENHLGSIL